MVMCGLWAGKGRFWGVWLGFGIGSWEDGERGYLWYEMELGGWFHFREILRRRAEELNELVLGNF
jgi:hypothetical protein